MRAVQRNDDEPGIPVDQRPRDQQHAQPFEESPERTAGVRQIIPRNDRGPLLGGAEPRTETSRTEASDRSARCEAGGGSAPSGARRFCLGAAELERICFATLSYEAVWIICVRWVRPEPGVAPSFAEGR